MKSKTEHSNGANYAVRCIAAAAVALGLAASAFGAAAAKFNPLAGLAIVPPAAEDAKLSALAGKADLSGVGNILFLGDSLTDYNRGSNHVDLVAHYLRASGKGPAAIYNYAIGGDYILRVLSRLDGKKGTHRLECYSDIRSRPYDIAFVWLGGNDSKVSSSSNYTTPCVSTNRVVTGYERLADELRKMGAKRIVFMSSHSCNLEATRRIVEYRRSIGKSHSFFGIPERMEAFNAAVKEAAERKGCEFFNVYDEVKARPDKADLVIRDGVHLSEKGRYYFAEKLLGYLAGGKGAGR